LILRDGQALILPVSLATPAEIMVGIRDLEGLCVGVANDYLRRRSARLSDEQTAELVSYLMLAAWKEAVRYQPGRVDLLGYLVARLRFRCTDWYRSYFGRSKLPRPVFVSLDALRDQEQELEPDVA